MLIQHLNHAQRLVLIQRVGSQHLFCLIIIQIGAVAADCGCIEFQPLIKRVDGAVVTAGDDSHLDASLTGALQRLDGLRQNGFRGRQQGAVKVEGDYAIAHGLFRVKGLKRHRVYTRARA